MTSTSYFAGQIYGDTTHQFRDGSNFITGMLVVKIDRGDYFLVKTRGNFAYLVFKKKEYKDG